MKADRDQEPVLKLAGGLRRGILAVAKAALAARSSPQRAVRNGPTPATGKRPAARRVFGQKAVWLRPARECFRSCSVVAARRASLVAPGHPAFCPKTGPRRNVKQALRERRAVLIGGLGYRTAFGWLLYAPAARLTRLNSPT